MYQFSRSPVAELSLAKATTSYAPGRTSTPTAIGESTPPVFTRADFTVMNGEFDTDKYDVEKDGGKEVGVDIVLRFKPGKDVYARKIGMVQTALAKVAGTPAFASDSDKARSIPVQTRLTEPTGDHTTIRFTGVALNGALPGSAFDLKLPSGVEEVK